MKLSDIRDIIKEMMFDGSYDHEKDHDKDYIYPPILRMGQICGP